ncbi:integrin alpha-2-like [Osmerus mordax]|uniref:integrin alpha-2-like n=1 Tax=Osmerus mordax TaxID=8014 RepID=UPI00350F4B7D
MLSIGKDILVSLIILFDRFGSSVLFNVGTSGAKIFSGPTDGQFGYTVQQLTNHQGKWLLVGSPWSGYPQNRKGDIYKCPVSGSTISCDKLNIQDSMDIPNVRNINTNMSLGLALTRRTNGFMTCGPLWGQQCGSQIYYPGACVEVSPLFKPHPAFSPSVQTCGGPMDILIVLDGSNSIYPWTPMNDFLTKLIPALDIGPQSALVSVIQYAVEAKFEFRLRDYNTKKGVLEAVSKINQMYGHSTNTFHAISYACQWGFHADSGGRPGVPKVMVVITDGESHDRAFRDNVIQDCEKQQITRFGIAVLGYYSRNNIDTTNLIAEIKSIASVPSNKYFFNVSEEAALSTIAGSLGNRIFSIEGTGTAGENFKMEMSQVGFSAHYSSSKDVMMLGAVGAYGWSGTVVHLTGAQVNIFPSSAFENILHDRNHSSLLGYSVTTLSDGASEYFVAGAPRANHSGQVIVYTVNSQKQLTVVDSERGKQIGSYFGSVLCPLDVDRDGVSDLLLVAAPMFMSDLRKEQGVVYLYSVTKGVLSDHGVLQGPAPGENARFGTALSAAPDLDLDGCSDVVVGAPLEDGGRGAVYLYNGEKKTLRTQFSQRILGSKLDSKMQYFGRSLDSYGDLNGDTIPDVSVGAHGKVIQLWSLGVATVIVRVSFTPDNINILNKPCLISGRKLSCFEAKVCFTASFKPKNPVGPVVISYNVLLDADLQSTHVTSRGLFSQNNDRLISGNLQISSVPVCQPYQIYVQETPDFVNSISLRVDISQLNSDSNPVLNVFSPHAWEFFIPFSKDCGSDKVCVSDLVLKVNKGKEIPSDSTMLVSYKNRRISFEVLVSNKMENAYNTRVLATYSKNLFYASITPPSEGTSVKCSTSAEQSGTLACQVAYPALKRDQQGKFWINFDFNLNHLQKQAQVTFEAKSDGEEKKPKDNKVVVTIPVSYDAEVIMTAQSNINFYVVDEAKAVKTTINNLDDIGPEFNFFLKISTGNIPVSLVYLTIFLPNTTDAGNPLLYFTGLSTQSGSAVSCDINGLVDPLRVGVKQHKVSFKKDSFRGLDQLDCEHAQCTLVKCILKDMKEKSHYFVNVSSRIWSSSLVSSTFQTVVLTASAEMKTSQPNLLVIAVKKLQVLLTVSKPGETADVPVGVIVGSVIGGLLLLALAVGLLWKFGFFKRKYKQLQKAAGEAENEDEQGP